MGYSFTAYSVFGCQIPFGDTCEIKHHQGRKKAFEHDFPQDWKVDPKTGRDLWRTWEYSEYIYQEQVFECTYSVGDEIAKILSGNQAIIQAVYSDGFDGHYPAIYAGIISTIEQHDNAYHQFSKVPDPEKVKAELQKYNLWNEDTFGLHQVMNWS